CQWFRGSLASPSILSLRSGLVATLGCCTAACVFSSARPTRGLKIALGSVHISEALRTAWRVVDQICWFRESLAIQPSPCPHKPALDSWGCRPGASVFPTACVL